MTCMAFTSTGSTTVDLVDRNLQTWHASQSEPDRWCNLQPKGMLACIGMACVHTAVQSSFEDGEQRELC